jgi:A118 family predicted phage portal protein
MGLINFVKGVWRRMFPIRDIKSALNIKIALTEVMLRTIEEWYGNYCGNAKWVNEEKGVQSLRLEQSITREFANIVLNEMTASVTNDRLNDLFNKATNNINMHLQEGLATGAMVIKPLGADKVQYVSANAFIPVEFDAEGKLLKVIFPEFKKIGDNYFTRLEYHELDEVNGLTITNRAYMSSSANSLGREIPLESVEEWVDLLTYVNYPLMKRQAFGYYRNPIKNDIDGSHCGVSVFNSAIDTIKKADIQFGRLDWEFESGERAIYADETVLKSGKGRVAKLKERLFRTVDVDGGTSGDFFKEFSPQLRQSDIIAGLEEYKRAIEFQVGLAYGDLSNPATVAKTATEIKSAKDRKFNTVTAIQNNLKACLDDLVYALAFYNSLATSNYKFACTFKDSILADDEAERRQDMQDMNMGIMRKEEYRAKWYGEDIETAVKNLPESGDVLE